MSPWLLTWLANYKRASRSGTRLVLLTFHSQNGFFNIGFWCYRIALFFIRILTFWNRKYKYYCLYFSFITLYPSLWHFCDRYFAIGHPLIALFCRYENEYKKLCFMWKFHQKIAWPLGDMNFIFSCWKCLSIVRFAHSWEVLSALEDKIRIPARSQNILDVRVSFKELPKKIMSNAILLIFFRTKISSYHIMRLSLPRVSARSRMLFYAENRTDQHWELHTPRKSKSRDRIYPFSRSDWFTWILTHARIDQEVDCFPMIFC